MEPLNQLLPPVIVRRPTRRLVVNLSLNEQGREHEIGVVIRSGDKYYAKVPCGALVRVRIMERLDDGRVRFERLRKRVRRSFRLTSRS